MRLSKISPPVLVTLLALAFGAGLIVRLPDIFPPSPAPTLSPLSPTPFPPTPTSPPTPTAPDAGDALGTLYIKIAPADMAQIEAKRQDALQLGILLAAGSDYVPATVRLGHETEIPVELRLKGDWIDHIAHEKWSFRVRAQGENYVAGMSVFSLHDPSMRTFLNEWAFLRNLRWEGVLAVRYRFVRLVLNGEYRGIYALEESFAKELLESQGRREGPIIRYDEDLVWEYRAFYDDKFIPRGANEFHIVDEFQSGRVDADPTLSAQRDIAVGLLRALWTGERDGADVFDLQTMAKFLALSDLWGAHHGLIWHNLRYYYNPITARLEPIAFDCDPLPPQFGLDTVGLPPGAFYHDPHLQAAYVRELERISRPGYVESLKAQLGTRFDALHAALEPEFGAEDIAPPWGTLRRRQDLIRQVLNPYQMVYAYVQRPAPGPTATLHIDVGNLLDLPVEIVGFAVEDELLPARTDWCASESADLVAPATANLVLQPLDSQATYMPYVHLRIPRAAITKSCVSTAGGADVPEFGIITRIWGLTTTHTQPVAPGYAPPLAQGPLPDPPTVAQALAQHPYLERVETQNLAYLRIASGTWEIDGNLILPSGMGLRLEPGVTLRFGPHSYLLASGPLDFQGTADAPILLQPISLKESAATPVSLKESAATPNADHWGGVVVLQADAPSAWSHVTVERASAVSQDGWTLTGGVTFYQSPIRLEHCRILDSQGEDGVNIIHTQFEIIASEFAHTASDALDADFAQGTIEESVFYDIGGDGIDVSGSNVQVHHVRLLDIGDKGISVGEASQLTARDVYFENVAWGMVSKDLSRATIEDAVIVNARRAGLAAYIKKPAYGPASLDARSITFVDTPPERRTLVQTGSWIDWDGARVWGTDVDTDEF